MAALKTLPETTRRTDTSRMSRGHPAHVRDLNLTVFEALK
jgi:hypothetical protein